MEQEKSKVRYESNGIPEKQVKLVKVLAVILVICGILLFIIAPNLYGDAEDACKGFGVFAVVVGGILFCCPKLFMKRYESAMLKIYEDHVEGMSFSPNEFFTLKFDEIYDVKKASMMGWNMLVIESENRKYVAVVNDLDTAYFIINQKLDELEKVE